MTDLPPDPQSAPPPSIQPPSAQPPSAQPAGWYPDGTGGQRYWSGEMWTEHHQPAGAQLVPMGYAMSPADERQMGMLAHALGIFTWIGPLIIYLTQAEKSLFVKHHATEALNFAITMFIATMISFVLIFVLIGLVLVPVVIVTSLAFHIMGAMAANRGEWYRYPISIRMIAGAQG